MYTFFLSKFLYYIMHIMLSF